MLTEVLTDFAAHLQSPAEPLRIGRSGVLRRTGVGRAVAGDRAAPGAGTQAPWQVTNVEQTERYLDLRLSTVHGDQVAGQIVTP